MAEGEKNEKKTAKQNFLDKYRLYREAQERTDRRHAEMLEAYEAWFASDES